MDFSLLVWFGDSPSPVIVPDPVDSKVGVRSGLWLTFWPQLWSQVPLSSGRDTGLGKGCQSMGVAWMTPAQLLPELSHEGGSPSVPNPPQALCCLPPDPRHLRSSCCSLKTCLAPNMGVKCPGKLEGTAQANFRKWERPPIKSTAL